MSEIPGRRAWGARLAELCEVHGVPGAVLGVERLADGRVDRTEEAHGLLHTGTGVETTTDSVFQIGSITKVMTATVALQLVDEGRIGLDQPVLDAVPDLSLGGRDAAGALTLRHLLTHTSGIPGDVFTDTGRGDDCLERYAASLPGAGEAHPVGGTWSYCNSGYSLLGHVIERLTGGTWDEALSRRLFEPLGLTRSVTLPEQALLHRAAVGHVPDPDGTLRPTRIWTLPRSSGPAGNVVTSVGELLDFARMHLDGGVAASGDAVLSAESTALMQERHMQLPDRYTLGDSWGLGWFRDRWDDRLVIGHDGDTIGQSAFLRVLPDQGLAVALLTNGGRGRDLFHELFAEVFRDEAGVRMRPRLEPSGAAVTEPERYVGRYERESLRTEVRVGDRGLVLAKTTVGPLATYSDGQTHELELQPAGEDVFVMRAPGARTWTPVVFYRLPDGSPYVHFAARASRRVS